jgi:hypothetical protein
MTSTLGGGAPNTRGATGLAAIPAARCPMNIGTLLYTGTH